MAFSAGRLTLDQLCCLFLLETGCKLKLFNHGETENVRENIFIGVVNGTEDLIADVSRRLDL